jgi:RHS repeat-associated protein
MNRMTAGYYSTSALNDPLSFNYNVNYFSEKITYDPIGNIINFKRWQKGGTIIDDLDYRYNPSTSAVKTNQFYQINDNCSILQTGYFNEAVQNPDEYTYNANGSLNSDNNKGCFTFYNHLELPAQINIGTQSIDFLYDAAGNKIAQHPSNENWTYFINGIEYEDNAAGPILKNIATSEGRVRPKDPYSAINPNITFVYDYFIKDYLGSIRAILSEEYFDRRYLATMEDQNSNAEEDLFYNIAESREENPPNKPTDYSYTPDEKVSLLNAWLGKPIGHAKLLEVNEGDNVSFTTKYFFEDAIPDTSSVRPIQSILNQLAGIFFLNTSYGPAGNTLESQQEWANNTFLMNASLSAFLNDFFSTIEGDPNYPNKAFVTYLMFDKEFNFVPEKSGVLLADQPNQLEQIGLLNIDIEKNGYFYVYVSNEGGRDVSFDLLQINNLNGFMRENNTYYPYGLLNPHLSFSNSYMNSKNNYKFQGKYLISNFDFNEMEFGLRYYNPVIGRWNAIDPQSQSRLSISGYNFVQNNPIIRIDPDGALDEWYKDAEGEMQFDPEVKNQEQARKKGGTYVGPTATETSKRGGSIEYRVDGSINFSNETDAYERMDKYGIKHESLAAIKTDGVLVLPTYLNDENSSYFAEYGYGFSPKGNLKDPVSNTTVTILGTLHTHLNKDFGDPDPSLDDVATFTHNTPNKPFATMGHDGKMHIGKGTSELLNWFNFPKGYVSNQNFLNGASLIDLYKQLRNK